MKYLLDTCVISELVAKQPNPRVLEWIDTVDADGVYISVITVGEIIKGIEKLPNSKRRQELSDWLESELLIRFQDNLIELDVNILIQWGRLNARLEISGQRAPVIDSLIAATALEHDLILVTRNESDFAGTEVEILNPWE
ncbi:MAG: type II toxin-antitoxin system VapC family toxin [Anaerolineales bacterium]|nr:type II toxin-antitoxin system VapC family toxin [Anaerolineales bacterium]NUQ83497.1 type II toxin-antitoxin system VapC family toxin [Anaerolineales bacterium]